MRLQKYETVDSDIEDEINIMLIIKRSRTSPNRAFNAEHSETKIKKSYVKLPARKRFRIQEENNHFGKSVYHY